MTSRHLHRLILVCAGILGLAANHAAAQCPTINNAYSCASVITVTDQGAYTSAAFTNYGEGGPPPFTLIGVVNQSSLPITSLALNGSSAIFGFNGQGVDNFGVAGNGFDSTGYGGQNAYFTNISGDQTSGTVNFLTPITTGGGTSYFSLAGNLNNALSCSSVLNYGVAIPPGGGTQITSSFTPNFGYSLASAAQLCGFTAFDWQQTITVLPSPSPFYDAGAFENVTAPTSFNDPPPAGYTYQFPYPNAVGLPVYYNLAPVPDPGSCTFYNGQYLVDCRSLYLPLNQTNTTLSFYDSPADSCLAGGSGTGCGGNAPVGSYLGFTTHLVGIVGTYPNATVIDTGLGFDWTDNFNGTSGGTSVTNSPHPIDPGSGTGGITVIKSNSLTTYQNPSSLVITAINGHKSSQVPSPTLLSKSQISTWLLGLTLNRHARTYLDVLTIRNISSKDIQGPIQILIPGLPQGVTVFKATGYFGNDPYITIPKITDLPPGGMLIFPIILNDPAMTPVKVTPLSIYAGAFK